MIDAISHMMKDGIVIISNCEEERNRKRCPKRAPHPEIGPDAEYGGSDEDGQ